MKRWDKIKIVLLYPQHYFTWFAYNVFLASIPILMAYIGLSVKDIKDGYVAGILYFCFALISAATYTYHASRNKDINIFNRGGLSPVNTISLIWLISILTVVIILPVTGSLSEETQNFMDKNSEKIAMFTYIISISYAFFLNYNQISSLIHSDRAKMKIPETINKAKKLSDTMNDSLNEEREF